MTKLEQMIKELCPEGVEYKKIGEVTEYEQPSKYIVETTKYNDEYKTPVLTAGQTFILGYTDEKNGIYPASPAKPVIIFDDFTAAFKWVDFPFKVKSSAMKIITPREEMVLIRYLFHCMGMLNFSSSEHTRLWIGTYSDFKIPIPPLVIQAEVVRILDEYSAQVDELNNLLKSELEARKKQYEYYRDKLLDFGNAENERGGVQLLTLGDIGPVCMCKRILKSETSPNGDIPFYKIGTFGGKPNAYISKETFEKYKSLYSFPKKGDILISAAGTIGRTVIYDGLPAYFQDSNIVWISNDETKVLNKYLYYYYQLQPWNVSTGGTIARLYNDNISKAKIYVPPLPEQERIVAILDRFDKLCNDISEGLPAEIEARKKQYEYYRDRLLSFKER